MSIEKLISKGLNIGGKAVVDQDVKMKYVNELIQSELNSGNKWVQAARPSIIFLGVLVILCEILGIRIGLLMWSGATVEVIRNSTAMMEFFIVVWGGIVGTYVYKRPAEKQAQLVIVKKQLQELKEEKKDARQERRNKRRKRNLSE